MTNWKLSELLRSDHQLDGVDRHYALILINQPLPSLDFLRLLWSKAVIRICADGGANRLYDTFGQQESMRCQYLPHAIAGDFDSIRPDVKQYYESKGVKMERDGDLDSTDLEKAMRTVDQLYNDNNIDLILVDPLGGRFDHAFQCLNIAKKYQQRQKQNNRRVFLINQISMVVILEKGQHDIHVDLKYEGPTCGLIPVGEPSIITTTGLEWNLQNQESRFGGLISSSNWFAQEQRWKMANNNDEHRNGCVTVNISTDIAWTVEIRHFDNPTT